MFSLRLPGKEARFFGREPSLITSQSDEKVRREVESPLKGRAVGSLQGEGAKPRLTGAREVTADRVDLTQSAALRVRGSLVEAQQSALGLVQSNEVFLKQGAAAVVRSETAVLDGYAGIVAAKTVQVKNGAAALVAGREIRGQRIQALLVIGNRIEGDIHMMFDQRQALMVALLGGLFAGLILSMRRVLRRD